jgi:hypothetical protein
VLFLSKFVLSLTPVLGAEEFLIGLMFGLSTSFLFIERDRVERYKVSKLVDERRDEKGNMGGEIRGTCGFGLIRSS